MNKTILSIIISTFGIHALQAQIDSVQFPVSLYSFEAGLSDNATVLKWKTACYISYANFKIEKSSNGITFSTINSFIADRLRCLQPFTFIDSTDNTGNVFYRINAGDIDGHFYHSKIININNKQTDLKILSAYPTIINSNTTIVLSSPYDGNIKLELINLNGVLVKNYNYNLKKGVNNLSVDFNNVSKGSHWIRLTDIKMNQYSVAVIKQ
ncbi:MAG: hypothetical protein ABIO55_09260 [Ginsengibacter sp.]